MRLYFSDATLETIYAGKLPKRFNPVTAKKVRKVLDFLDVAVDTRDIRVYKALHFEKLEGNLDGLHSVRIIGTGKRVIFGIEGTSLTEVY